jgi:hypothetical protein
MNYWLVIKTDPMKEAKVSSLLKGYGIETAVPIKISAKTLSRRTRKKVIHESPVYARHVFAMVSHETELPDVMFSRGVVRDALGSAWTIPAPHMASWLQTHATWLENEFKRHSKGGKSNKANKPVKLASFEALKEYFDSKVSASDAL